MRGCGRIRSEFKVYNSISRGGARGDREVGLVCAKTMIQGSGGRQKAVQIVQVERLGENVEDGD
jgi:hypothetical protein